MKAIALGLTLLLGSLAFAADDITGTVTLAKGVEAKPGGVLFVFAKSPGVAGGPPLAVLRVADPKFPVKFELGAKNAMMPGTPFKGPFTVTARYSPSGDAIDKTGPQGVAKGEVKEGAKDVKIELTNKMP